MEAVWKFDKKCVYFIVLLFTGSFLVSACNQPEAGNLRKKIDYIRPIEGANDTIPSSLAQQGEVLIAYSDCYTCHKLDKKSIGPAFRDVAKRYPVQQVYINMLAQKIIHGGKGSWGQAVMIAHPNVSEKDARIMASFILSLKEEG